MEMVMTTLKIGNVKLQKKHIEQMLILNPLNWYEISTEVIDNQETETLKCIGFINIKVKTVMKKYYLFTNNKDKIFKFTAKNWTAKKIKEEKDKKNHSSKFVYYKNAHKEIGSYEDSLQYEMNNKMIIDKKLNETQIFI